MSRRSAALLIVLAMAGCRRSAVGGRYLVTAAPLDVGLSSTSLCIAVDPEDEHGVWWWQPGGSGCASRSSDVLQGQQAFAGRSTELDVVTAGFRLPLHATKPPYFLDVRVVIQDGRMRMLDHRAAVAVRRRPDLIVPTETPR